MKQYRFTAMLLSAAIFFLCACGGEKEASTETATTDSSTTTTTETTPVAAPASTITTAPQGMVIIKHKIGVDYDKWKAAYDAHDSARLANGLHNYVLGRSVTDPTMIMVALKADDMAKAKAFAKDPGLKAAMQKGGVSGAPTIMYITAIFQDTAVISSQIRSMTISTVKDMDTWHKAFDEGKQERLDNGITTRVIAHDPDNDKKVILVTALNDTAKANAYWVSDALKKRREAGGVISKPDRFVFEVVQRYK